MLTLYYHPYSQHSRRVAALLEETAIPHDKRYVALENDEHLSDEYLAINPNHQVPTLVDGETRIHESNDIMRYLCDKHELAEWYPADPAIRAQVDRWLDWNQSQLARPVVQVVLNSLFMGDKGDKAAIEAGKAAIEKLGPVLEDALSDSSYLAGDTVTIADLSVASNITQLKLANAEPQTPAVTAWYERIVAVPGFQKTLPA